MAINLVINGYFRSGTTFFWELIKNNTDRYTVFYEPLNPRLPKYVFKEAKLNEKHSGGSTFLWNEYNALDTNILKKLYLNHPNLEKTGIVNSRAFNDYFDIYHKLPFSVALQPNRAHMFLDVFFNRYESKVVHIIRHPLDVLLSIETGATKHPNSLKHLLKKYILKHRYMKKMFDDEFFWLQKHTGDLYDLPNHIMFGKENNFKNFTYFEKFVVVWTLYNYYALKDVEKYRGLLMPYELFYTNNELAKQSIMEYLELEQFNMDLKSSNYYKFEQKRLDKFNEVVDKYKIREQYNYICEYMITHYEINYNKAKS